MHSDLKCETSTGFENENKNLRSMAFLSPFKDEHEVVACLKNMNFSRTGELSDCLNFKNQCSLDNAEDYFETN